MSTTPREIGTLIVVVLKANHLPNKRNIGKQDPYCTVIFNGEERNTRAVKRGGQHPEWDEEIRFTLYEDIPDRLPSASGAPPPPPPKDDRGPPKVKGGTTMKLLCYAQEREPDLIGECKVDLTEVLTKGETDEWFTLMNKDKFCGKVYLELTFYANAPAPVKKVTPKPVANKQYAGPGSFVPLGDPTPVSGAHPGRSVSASGAYDHGRNTSESIPTSLRASNALAKLDLYVPPYEQRNRLSGMDQLTQDFNEFGVSDQGRRAGTLPPRTPITPRPVTPSYSQGEPYASYYNNQPGQVYIENQYPGPGQQQPAYSNGQAGRPSTMRAPRHSIPTASSGFVPLPSTSTYNTVPHHHSPEPSGPAYDPNAYTNAAPHPSHTSAPVVIHSHMSSSGSGSYMPPPHSFSAPQQTHFNQYAAPQAAPTPAPHLQISGQVPSPGYSSPGYASGPIIDNGYGQPVQQMQSVFQSNAAASRPLPPQPQVVYAQQPIATYTPAPPVIHSYPSSSYAQQPAAPLPPSNYQALPPPPPPPQVVDYNHSVPSPHRHSSLPTPPDLGPPKLPTPPPPPPLQTINNIASMSQRRSSSLPQPPIFYQEHIPQQDAYNIPYPPPPPPPLPEQEYEYQQHAQLPPPPPPSGLPMNPPTSSFPQGSWIAPGGVQYTQAGYV